MRYSDASGFKAEADFDTRSHLATIRRWDSIAAQRRRSAKFNRHDFNVLAQKALVHAPFRFVFVEWLD